MAVVFEMWAFPEKDEHVNSIYNELKADFEKPIKLTDFIENSFSDSESHAAVFIPGGHGAMLGIPEDENVSCAMDDTSVLDENRSKMIPSAEDNSTIDLNTSVELEDLNCTNIEVLETSQTDDDINECFLTRTLLEERDKSYVRVSFLQGFNSLGKEEFEAKLRARVYFTQSRKRLI